MLERATDLRADRDAALGGHRRRGRGIGGRVRRAGDGHGQPRRRHHGNGDRRIRNGGRHSHHERLHTGSGNAALRPGAGRQDGARRDHRRPAPRGGRDADVRALRSGLGTQLGTPSTETITIVDDDPIDTAITAGPDGPINTATATFSFLAEPPEGATFACSIDGAAAVACTSPHTTAALADGPHTFSVTASTPGGTADPSPATRGFFVDTVAPQSGLDVRATPGAGAQTGPGVFTGSVTVSAIGADPDPGSGIGQVGCSLDPLAVPTTADEVRAGTCPVVTAPGDHVAYAVATDKAGNTGPIVTSTFRIIAAPDTFITSGPTSVSWTTTPTFTFTSTDPAATFRCKVDAYDAVDCKSPFRILPGVSGSGAHSIAVTAVSPAGVADPSPARRDFKVGETETHDFGCGLNGFAVDPASNDGYAGCTIEPAGQPCSGLYPACQSAVPACPVGAFCRYDVKVNGADKDLHVNLLTNAVVVERVTPEVREKHGFAYLLPGYLTSAGCFHNDPTQDGGGSCPASAFNQIIGDGSAPSFLCPTNSSRNTSGGILPKLGPDADRFSRCDFKMTIEAAPTLVVLPADDGITTYAPGAGRLSAAPAGAGGRTAAIARAKKKKKAKPLFRKTTKRVNRAGPVRLKLALSRAAKKTLKKKKRLVLRVRLTFKPKQGRTVSRTAKVTLRKPVRPKAIPQSP